MVIFASISIPTDCDVEWISLCVNTAFDNNVIPCLAKASTIAGQGYSVDPTYGPTGFLSSIDYSQLIPNIAAEYKARMLAPGGKTLDDLQKLLTAGGIGIR